MKTPNEHSTREEIQAYLDAHGPYRYRPEGKGSEFVYVHTLDTAKGWKLNRRDKKILRGLGLL